MWSSVERDVGLFDLGVQAHVVEAGTVALLPDAFGGRAELSAEIALHRVLQPDEAVVAELVGEPHHGRRARTGGVGEVGDGAEADDLRPIEHDGRRCGARPA